MGGTWTISDEEAVAGPSSVLLYHFQADKVYIILQPSSAGSIGTVKVWLDGKVIDASVAGADVVKGRITVDSDRLYSVVDFHGKVEEHVLKLEF